jgi:acetyl esterase/lipase
MSLSLLLLAGIVVLALNAAAFAEPDEVQLWPGEAPGSEGVENIERTEGARVFDVTVPTLRYYPADKDKATGTAVVVCPGGGYSRLAMVHEGYDVAKWLNSLGVTAVLLKYRCGKGLPDRDSVAKMCVPDGMRAVRTVRGKAEELGVDPRRIGMMGFSAGANLASRLVARMDEASPDSDDPIERISCRPDFAALIYAPIAGLGPDTINDRTPPVFMVHAANDSIPNTECAQLFIDLYKAGVPAELHVFASGGHGFGLGNRGGAVTAWPALFAAWLSEMEKNQGTWNVDYLEPLGGEAKAVIEAGTTVAYKDYDKKPQTARAATANANKAGELMSEWSEANLGRRVGYAFCYLRSDKDQKIKCHFGSDDEAKIWIGGKLVCSNDRARDFEPRKDTFEAELVEGLNPVLIKVSQRSGMWRFRFEAFGDPARTPDDTGAESGTKPINDLQSTGVVSKWNVLNFHLVKAAPTPRPE